MYAKIIRVKCSHSSKPLLGCEIFRKDARLLGAYFSQITFGPLDQKWSFSMPKMAEIIPGAVPVASPPLAEAFQIK